jgi:hypothetical protein
METNNESEEKENNMERHYGYIECANAVEAVEIMAKLDSEGTWNDICYHYNEQEGLWIKFRER